MLIEHSMPTGITWTVSTAFLTDSDALNDGKPARVTRIEFGDGSPTIADFVSLNADWSTPKPIRAAKIIFQGRVPAGVKVQAVGKRSVDSGYPYTLGGNSTTQRTVQRPDGTVMIDFVFADGLTPLVGLRFNIFDDANGATFSDTYIDVGEVFIGQVAEVRIRPTLGQGMDDPTQRQNSIGNQPHVVRRKEAVTLDFEVAPVSFADAYTAETSLQQLRAALVGGQDCVVVFATRPPHTGAGAIDYDVVNAISLFGKCTDLGEIRAEGSGKHWTMAMSFRESPGRIVG